MKRFNEIYARPIVLDMVEEGGTIWMVLLDRNGIVKYDKATEHAEICKTFEGEPLERECLYRRLEKVGNKLVFSPGVAEKIAVYDIVQDIITYIPLAKQGKGYGTNLEDIKFWNSFQFQANVYLVGYSYPAIVKVDLKSMTIEYITDWLKEVEQNMQIDVGGGYFGDGQVIYGNVALLPVACMNAVLELDLETSRTKLRRVNVSLGGLGGIASADGENIWLVGRRNRTNCLSCWNRRDDTVKEFPIEDVSGDMFDPFSAPICAGTKVFLMPISAASIYEMDIETQKLRKCREFENKFTDTKGFLRGNEWGWRVLAPKLNQERLIFIVGSDLEWQEYNLNTGALRSYFIHIQETEEELEQYFDAIYSRCRDENSFFTENKMSLVYYIEKISHGDRREGENSNRAAGEMIYEKICGGCSAL